MKTCFSYHQFYFLRGVYTFRIFLVLVCFVLPFYATSQNLVTNGDFETYTLCPSNYAQMTRATGWLQPAPGTPDYYHTCSVNLNPTSNLAGGELPFSGYGFGGIVLTNSTGAYREYIETQLTRTLIRNRVYYFEMYVSLGDSSNFSSDKFGVYFSNDSIYSDSTRLFYTPQITTLNASLNSKSGWTKISSLYKAAGGERFITIGCFNATNSPNLTTYVGGGGITGAFSSMTYYYIDDVSLIDPNCDSIPTNRITSQIVPVCSNNQSFPKTLAPTHLGYTYIWGDSSLNTYCSVNTIGKYWVYTYTNNCPYVDTFLVQYTPVPTLNLGVDTTFCSASSYVIHPIHSPNVSFFWSNLTTDSILPVNANGNYWLKILNSAGCSAFDTVHITFNIIPNALGNDIDLCNTTTFPIKLSASKSFSNAYLWSSSATDSVIYVNDTGNYWVRMTKGACSVTDTINIKNTQLPHVLLGNDSAFCEGNSFNLTSPNADSYKWFYSNNTTNPFFLFISNNQNKQVSLPGLYLLELKKNTCTKKDTFKLDLRIKPTVNIGNDTVLCFNSTTQLNAFIPNAGIKYLWKNGDTSSRILVSNQDNYWVKVKNDVCEVFDSVNIFFENEIKLNLGNDTAACSNQVLTLTPNASNASSFKWQNNSTQVNLQANTTGVYWVDAIKGNCKVRDSIMVNIIQNPTVNLGPDTIYCLGQTFHYQVSYPGARYLWNTNSTYSFINSNTAGLYWAEINNQGCKARDSVNVTIFPLEKLNLGNDTSLCEGDTFSLKIISTNATNYLWNTNETAQTIRPNISGIYWAEASASFCKVRDSILVNFKPVPSVNLGLDTIICSNANLVIDSKVDSATYLWDDFSRLKTRSVKNVGFYTVKVTKNGCSAQDGIAVTTEDPPILDLGNDTTLCAGYDLNLQANVSAVNEYLWQNNSNLPYFFVNTAGTYTLRIKKGICYVTDSIKVSYVNKETINLGNDSDYCFNNVVVLKPKINATTYLWQDASNLDSFEAKEPGTYWVEINSETCKVRDSITLTQKTLPIIDLGTFKTVCINDTFDLNAQNVGSEYLWEDLSTKQIHGVLAPGIFYVKVKNNLGCYAIDSIQLDTFPAYTTTLGNDTFVCEGGQIKILAEAGFKSYLWQDNSTAQNFIATQPGTYFVTVKNDNDCKATDTVLLIQKPKPTIKFPSLYRLCEPDFMLIPDPNFVSYVWQDGSTEKSFHVNDYGIYEVKVTDKNYCENTAKTEVINYCEGKLIMPNAFTPNNDNVNDAIKPAMKNLLAIQYKIFNRWGQLVFETNEIGKGWDGKINDNVASSDVYFYTITYFGNNEITKTINGNFTLIR